MKVVVTTQFRGVFWGELTDNNAPASVELAEYRNCIYWNKTMNGFVGLSTYGPDAECKIGAKGSKITLYGITAILDCSAAASEKWIAA